MTPTRANLAPVLLAIGLLLAACPLRAATIVQGGNIIDQTWTTVGSPYVVNGDAIVPSGRYLTIREGVEVRFAASDAQAAGRDPLRVELTINGTLNISGTSSAPIRFQGQAATAGSWYGIIVRSPTVNPWSHLAIQHAVTGVVCEAGVTASDVRMFANRTAINVGGTGSLSLERAAIHGNVLQGLVLNLSPGAGVHMRNCTIHGNGAYGVYVGSASTISIINTIITGHGYGVYRSGSATVSVTYSDVWGNGTNLFNVVAGNRSFSADPFYVDADGADNILGTADDNLQLQPNSPCGWAGQTGEDIGAYPIIYKLRMHPLRFVGDDARLPITAVPNRLHQLQYTEDLTNWFSLGDAIRPDSSSLEFTNSGARTLPKRFYRIRLND